MIMIIITITIILSLSSVDTGISKPTTLDKSHKIRIASSKISLKQSQPYGAKISTDGDECMVP